MGLHWAYISVGSNLGDRLGYCCAGIQALCDDETVQLDMRSPFYETEPLDYTDQGWFLNAAVKISTTLSPLELLARTQAIQKKLGRKDTVRFGPRVLDLDIILYEDWVLQTPQLVIPHPRMHKRRFVLQPVCDIDPFVVHPVIGLNIKTLLNQTIINGQKINLCFYDC